MRPSVFALALVLVTGACSTTGPKPSAIDAPIPESAFQPPVGEVTLNEAVPPEAAGAGARRQMVVGSSARTDSLLLSQEAVAMRAQGWASVKCGTVYERCFESKDWFVVMVGRSHVQSVESGAFPTSSARTHRAELLVVVEPPGPRP